MNKDLQEMLSTWTVDSEKFSNLVLGRLCNQKRQELTAVIEEHKAYLHDKEQIPDDKMHARMWSRVDYIRKNEEQLRLFSDFSIDKHPYLYWMNHMIGLTPEFGIKYATFRSIVQNFGSEDQREFYSTVNGLFAETESANCCKKLSAIHTKAMYNQQTDNFEIRIPNSQWLHPLGRKGITHCVIFARLAVQKVDYGVHAFVIDLKSAKTETAVGRMERAVLQKLQEQEEVNITSFKHIVVPRDSMLMGLSTLDENGVYSKKEGCVPKTIYT
jgi:hypothetical protein